MRVVSLGRTLKTDDQIATASSFFSEKEICKDETVLSTFVVTRLTAMPLESTTKHVVPVALRSLPQRWPGRDMLPLMTRKRTASLSTKGRTIAHPHLDRVVHVNRFITQKHCDARTSLSSCGAVALDNMSAAWSSLCANRISIESSVLIRSKTSPCRLLARTCRRFGVRPLQIAHFAETGCR